MPKAQALQPPEAQPRRTAQPLWPEALRCQKPPSVAARRSLVAESTATDRESIQTDRPRTGAVSQLAAGSRHRGPLEIRGTLVDPVRGLTPEQAQAPPHERAPTAARNAR